MLKFSTILCIVFLGFFKVGAEQVPIQPKLELINDINGNVYTIYEGVADTANDAIFRPVLETTTKICFVGIWMFYPGPSFQMDPGLPLSNGQQIGTMEKYECIEDARVLASELKEMRSYRYLGPPNLNQFSLSVYAHEFAFGEQKIYDLEEFDFTCRLPFPVNSYLITAITDANASNQERLAPVVKVFWGENGEQENTKVCLAVIEDAIDENAEEQPKIYFGKNMTLPMLDEQLHFGSFFFLRYSTAITPGFCEEDSGQNMLGMIKLSNQTVSIN